MSSFLVGNGAAAADPTDDLGQSPLWTAAFDDRREIVNILLDAGKYEPCEFFIHTQPISLAMNLAIWFVLRFFFYMRTLDEQPKCRPHPIANYSTTRVATESSDSCHPTNIGNVRGTVSVATIVVVSAGG